MKIIYNDIIPFHGYIAMNIFGILFVRNEYKHKIDDVTINHESIHTEQYKDLFYIFFIPLYLIEWLFRLIEYGFNSNKAYKNISFEKEAYLHEQNMDYIQTRKKYAFWKLI